MRGVDKVVFICKLKQARCEPDIHALKHYVINQGKQIGNPAGICGKDEFPEHR